MTIAKKGAKSLYSCAKIFSLQTRQRTAEFKLHWLAAFAGEAFNWKGHMHHQSFLGSSRRESRANFLSSTVDLWTLLPMNGFACLYVESMISIKRYHNCSVVKSCCLPTSFPFLFSFGFYELRQQSGGWANSWKNRVPLWCKNSQNLKRQKSARGLWDSSPLPY